MSLPQVFDRLLDELREYLMPDYLLLYLRQDMAIYLLAIKHHRQLSFDFDRHWR